jgi:hypothetical protein
VPETSRFFGIIITMNYNITMNYHDHSPPHFHARYSSDQPIIDIQTVQVLGGARDTPGHGLGAWALPAFV